jgi:hypothetical protein
MRADRSLISDRSKAVDQRLWKVLSSAGLDLAPLVVHRQPDHLAGRRGYTLLISLAQLGEQRLLAEAGSAGRPDASVRAALTRLA